MRAAVHASKPESVRMGFTFRRINNVIPRGQLAEKQMVLAQVNSTFAAPHLEGARPPCDAVLGVSLH